MAKSNGTAKWTLVALAILTIAFNTGVTYNHLHNLSKEVDNLTQKIDKLDEKVDTLQIQIAGIDHE